MKKNLRYLWLVCLFTVPHLSAIPIPIPEITWPAAFPADVEANGYTAMLAFAAPFMPTIKDYFRTHIKNLTANLLDYMENNLEGDGIQNGINTLRALADPLDPNNEDDLNVLMEGTGLFLTTNRAILDPAQLGFPPENPHQTFNQICDALGSLCNFHD